MRHNFTGFIFTSLLLLIMSGCATQQTRTGNDTGTYCSIAGAAVGGGVGAALTLAATPVGVFIGAIAGYYLCNDDTPEPETVAAITPEPVTRTPVPVDYDSDGDGVMDRQDRCPDTPANMKVDAYGCPPILLALTGVQFRFDSSVVEPASESILDQAVAALNKAKSVDVRIVGHTDSIGTDEYNLKLSQRRADAVRDYLVAQGITPSRLTTEGRGESQPVTSNSTDSGRHQNRRVEFHVTGSDQ